MGTRHQIASPTTVRRPKPIIWGETPIAAGKKKRRKYFLRFFTPNSDSPAAAARSRRNPSRGESPAVSPESASFRPQFELLHAVSPHGFGRSSPGFPACSLPIGESASGLARSSILSAALLNLAVERPSEFTCSEVILSAELLLLDLVLQVGVASGCAAELASRGELGRRGSLEPVGGGAVV